MRDKILQFVQPMQAAELRKELSGMNMVDIGIRGGMAIRNKWLHRGYMLPWLQVLK